MDLLSDWLLLYFEKLLGNTSFRKQIWSTSSAWWRALKEKTTKQCPDPATLYNKSFSTQRSSTTLYQTFSRKWKETWKGILRRQLQWFTLEMFIRHCTGWWDMVKSRRSSWSYHELNGMVTNWLLRFHCDALGTEQFPSSDSNFYLLHHMRFSIGVTCQNSLYRPRSRASWRCADGRI